MRLFLFHLIPTLQSVFQVMWRKIPERVMLKSIFSRALPKEEELKGSGSPALKPVLGDRTSPALYPYSHYGHPQSLPG